MSGENFIDYEKSNNDFLKSLKKNSYFLSLLMTLNNNPKTQKYVMLLVPHAQSMELRFLNSLPPQQSLGNTPQKRRNQSQFLKSQIQLLKSQIFSSPSYGETHICIANPSDPSQFCSLNGICGQFCSWSNGSGSGSDSSNDSTPQHSPESSDSSLDNFSEFTVLTDKSPPDFSVKDQLSSNPEQIFLQKQQIFSKFSSAANNQRIHILRKSMLDVDEFIRFPLFIISEPIEHKSCTWSWAAMTDTLRKSIQSENNQSATPEESIQQDSSFSETIRSGILDMFSRRSSKSNIKPMTNTNTNTTNKVLNSSAIPQTSIPAPTSTDVAEKAKSQQTTKQIPDNSFEKEYVVINPTSQSQIQPEKHEIIDSHQIDEPNVEIEDVDEQGNSKNPKKGDSFQEFVSKMNHKSATPLVNKIKHFIDEINSKSDLSASFGDAARNLNSGVFRKKTNPFDEDNENPVAAKVKNFLEAIFLEIKNHPQWKNAARTELDASREGIEKYVMTKIHDKFVFIDFDIFLTNF